MALLKNAMEFEYNPKRIYIEINCFLKPKIGYYLVKLIK